SPLFGAGGGGINVSRAIHRLGGTATAVFPAGGATGDRLVLLLKRENVPANVIPVEEPTREDINVVETGSGNEYRFVVPGTHLSHHEWEDCLRALRAIDPPPDIVVASGSLPRSVPVDFYARLASMALERHFQLIVDTSGEPLRYAATAGTFLLKPNAGELASISGGAISESMVEDAARSVVATGRAKAVVVSTGASGAILADDRGLRRIAAPMVTIGSKAGAGDSMVAGIALSLARGWDLDDAVQFGVAAGSAAVMAAGHQLCTREDTEMLFERLHARPESAAV
ncbi:MAG: 1-phosphofructokinase family hexose kinase, partial [Thermoanaerobaculia bacterium]